MAGKPNNNANKLEPIDSTHSKPHLQNGNNFITGCTLMHLMTNSKSNFAL